MLMFLGFIVLIACLVIGVRRGGIFNSIFNEVHL